MSVNIQLENGLKKISGQSITRDKIIAALGYAPANKEVESTVENHINDTNAHITSSERTKWNAKSEFSGSYNDLTDKPNITDDGSDAYLIADKSGNVIAKIDAAGIHSVDMTIDGLSIKDKINELENKSEFSGSYNDLTDKPNIMDDGSDVLYIADQNGNVILKIGNDGVYTTDVSIQGKSVLSVIELLEDHLSDTDIHVTAEEKAAWNAKSDFSGSYNDLNDKPNIMDDESDKYTITDKDGNVIFMVDENGAHSVDLMLDGVSMKDKINALETGSNINISAISEEDILALFAEEATV
jgi:hypothetical protein